MSDYLTYESEICDRLNTLGYEVQPDNYDIQDENNSNAFVHKGYSIKVIEIDRQSIIDGHAYHTYLIELKISFLNNDENSRSDNFIEFDDLLTELVNGGTYFPNFVNINSNPTFIDEDISLQSSIGTIQMWYGMRGC